MNENEPARIASPEHTGIKGLLFIYESLLLLSLCYAICLIAPARTRNFSLILVQRRVVLESMVTVLFTNTIPFLGDAGFCKNGTALEGLHQTVGSASDTAVPDERQLRPRHFWKYFITASVRATKSGGSVIIDWNEKNIQKHSERD
jgi:hypothetical protein